ncbi:MAG: LysE family translocator [Thermoanaerobaculales bacterium]
MDLISLAALFGSAFVVTFATVLVPNPSTVAASRLAMRDGTRAAAIFLGAVLTLDTIVFLVLVFGLHPFLRYVGAMKYLAGAAGLGLVVAGAVMAVTARRDATRLVARSKEKENGRSRNTHGPFLAGLLVPSANPGFWIWWTTVGTSFIHAARQWGDVGLALLLIAFIGGAAAWYVPLLWTLQRGRQAFSQRAQERVLFSLGLAMIGFGVFLLWRSLAAVV